MSQQAKLGYLLTLVAFLSAPFILGRTLSRKTIYESLSRSGRGAGDFEFLRRMVFEEKGDIDILFAGTSKIWNAIAPEIIEEGFRKSHHDPVVIRNIGINWQGQDATYTVLRDLLAHRRVKVLVLGVTLPADPTLELHKALYELWTHDAKGEFVIDAFPPKDQISYWSTRIYDWPRKLLSVVRKDHPSPNDGYLVNGRYGNLETGLMLDHSPFVDFEAKVPNLPTENWFYGQNNQGRFEFLDSLNGIFVDRIVELANHYGTQVALVETPFMERYPKAYLHQRLLNKGNQSRFLMGYPTAELFAELSQADVAKLFYDPRHLNWNGTRFFSKVITPAIIKVYDEITRK